jgi:hypothetical protein
MNRRILQRDNIEIVRERPRKSFLLSLVALIFDVIVFSGGVIALMYFSKPEIIEPAMKSFYNWLRGGH